MSERTLTEFGEHIKAVLEGREELTSYQKEQIDEMKLKQEIAEAYDDAEETIIEAEDGKFHFGVKR